MAESGFSHLVKIVYQSIGAEKATADSNKVDASLLKWDTGKHQAAIDSLNTSLNKTGKEISSIVPHAKQGQSALERFTGVAQKALIVAPTWIALRAAMMGTFQFIGSQIKFLKDLESAMARIRIVGKGTELEFRSLGSAIVTLGYLYGVSASEAAEAATVFAQQGRTISETIELTRIAAIGAKILGTDIKSTVDNLTAAIQGFKIPVSEAITIVNKWSNVEREFAVTAQDLANATKVAGASANQLGITMSEFLGDVTAIIEVTRKSGDEAARGLQFMYARLLTTAKPVIEQIAKVPFYLDKENKATFALTNTTRNFSDILGEVAGKWNTLTVEEKLSIATALGSKRQMTTINALMQNYTRSVDARISSIISAGIAEKNLAIVQDTVAFKTEQVTSAWNNLTTAVADTNAWKGMLDILSEVAITLTYAANAEKGYNIDLLKEISKRQKLIEFRKAEVSSLQELFRLQTQLEAAPTNDINSDRLKVIKEAIESYAAISPKLQLAIQTGDSKEIAKQIQQIQLQFSKQTIDLNLKAKFGAQELALLDKQKVLMRDVYSINGQEISTPYAQKQKKQLEKINQDLLYIEKEKTNEYKSQLAINEQQLLAEMAITDEIAFQNSGELTEAESERLDIERELNTLKYHENTTTEELVLKEIELVKLSQYNYDKHERTLKLEQLQNQLIDARLQKRKQEKSEFDNLLLQYEKADETQRKSIERLLELQNLSPEDLASRFKNDLFDRNVIEQYWANFEESGKNAITKTIQEMYRLNIPNALGADMSQNKYYKNYMDFVGKGSAIGGIGSSANPAGKFAVPLSIRAFAEIQQILVNIDAKSVSETGKQLAQKITDAILNDPEFKKMWAKQLRPEM